MRVIILIIWCAAAINLDFLNDMVSKIETKADSVKQLNNNRHNKMDQARQLVQGLRGRRRTRRKNRMQNDMPRKSPRQNRRLRTRLNKTKSKPSSVIYKVGKGEGNDFQLTRIETRPFNPDTDMWPSK